MSAPSSSGSEAKDSAHRLPRVLSGIQPSGAFHLGNYLGAVRQWVAHQDDTDGYFCIVDLHAITVPQDPEALLRSTREVAALLLACGIDPQRSTLFVQSHVRAHAELSWVLGCLTPLGWLERMTQFKSKSGKQQARASSGLLTYPVLQAADILLYDADQVPVGEDQRQHLELARDIAGRFNHLYGETFVLPEAVIPKVGARIMGLDDPTSKMSKSSAHNRGHAVRVTDSPKEIEWVLKRAVTDSGREICFSEDDEKAGVNNLLTIYQLLTAKDRESVLADFAEARGYGDLKKAVAEAAVEALRPIREEFERLMQDPAELDRQLAIGAERARELAEPKIAEVKEKVGFWVPGD
ncbi:MAG: tryptophan--tRNA ligase [Acidobacteriota bacterium]